MLLNLFSADSNVIEVEVHQTLRGFLREQGEPYWVHHLTMARLVARALRIGRSALIQTGTHQGHYRLSYLVPLLMWAGPVVLVAPPARHQRLSLIEIPRLRQWIQNDKPIVIADRFPSPDFQGILVTTPAAWLADRLAHTGQFPAEIPTIFDAADDLENVTREVLTLRLEPQDWEALMLACPAQLDLIRDTRVALTRELYQHPANPYECFVLATAEQELLLNLGKALRQSAGGLSAGGSLPDPWQRFFAYMELDDRLAWCTIARPQGLFTLCLAPIDVAAALAQAWAQQPTVLIGEAVDLEADATLYRSRIGLGEVTCLKFAPDRQEAMIQLYQPEGIPLPNTPQYQAKMLAELRGLLSVNPAGFSVVLVGDYPLKSQLGAQLAAEYGSRVQVDQTCLDDNGILVTDWEFWQQQQMVLPHPQLLVITTLPIPSLEHPIVAGRVAYYKHLRRDWFRLYLLPEALSILQRAIAPVRDSQGVVALLDSRVLFRSYGDQVLSALSPFARLNYFDGDLFMDAANAGYEDDRSG
jgi:ATP-dependent DNA helicase DinG